MLRIRKNEYTDRKWSFSCVYPGIRARKTPILQNFTKRAKEQPRTKKSFAPSFAYPRIRVSIGLTKTQPNSSLKILWYQRFSVAGHLSDRATMNTDNWVSPWLSCLIMYGVEFWSVPSRAPHVNSTKWNWYGLCTV